MADDKKTPTQAEIYKATTSARRWGVFGTLLGMLGTAGAALALFFILGSGGDAAPSAKASSVRELRRSVDQLEEQSKETEDVKGQVEELSGQVERLDERSSQGSQGGSGDDAEVQRSIEELSNELDRLRDQIR